MNAAAQNAYLRLTVPLAQAAQRKWGVPASITLAQSIVESSDDDGNWGNSQLSRLCNNFFGIKAAHSSGKNGAAPEPYQAFPTREYAGRRSEVEMAHFVRYDSIGESFEAHARLLATAPRYKPCMAVSHDPARFALQLQLCGYSTNFKYPDQLMFFVRKYDLAQYDTPPDEPAQKAEAA